MTRPIAPEIKAARAAARKAWQQRAKLGRQYKITQDDVAALAGVDRSLVSKCLRGKAVSANVEEAYDRIISARMDDERRAVAAALAQQKRSA